MLEWKVENDEKLWQDNNQIKAIIVAKYVTKCE